MRAARNLQLYSIFFLVFSTYVAAWPWPEWLPDLDSLVVRADSSNSTTSTTAKQTTSGTDSASPSETGSSTTSKDSSATTTGKTSSVTGKTTATKTSGSSTTKKSSHTSYDARLPAGGVSLLTPAAASSTFYKIGDYITFAWNYTSLSATPTAVNVMATCTVNSQLYTIAANQSIAANGTQAVTWDSGAYQATAVGSPLLTETYTLLIYDADGAVTDSASAGYLAPYDTYQFGMYTAQAYTPLGEFKCATCSGALSDMERKALGMVFGMGVLTVLSFTWFVAGTGIIW